MYRKSTAGQHLGFGLVVASTGAALAGATVTVSRVIDGGAQATATGTVSEKGLGQYDFAPTAEDLNGNQVSFLFTAATAVSVEKTVVTTATDPTNGTSFGLSNLAVAVSTPPTAAAVATAAWTKLLNSADFATENSVGAVLKEMLVAPANFGVAESSTSNSLTLRASEPMALGNLAGWRVLIIAGTGAGQVRTVASSASRVQTMMAEWTTPLDANSVYELLPPNPVVGGSATDPWSTSLTTGSYPIGSAGANIIAIKSKTDKLPAVPAAAGGTVVIDDKTGFKLAPDGLDAIPTTPPAFGSSPNFRQMVVMTWRRWFRKHVASGTTLTGYADDGITVTTTQTVPAVPATQTQGAA